MRRCVDWRVAGKRIVTTNGTFDILHSGHLASIREAASHGDILVVGINSDASVKRYKSTGRPFLSQEERCLQVAYLPWVDAVHVFDEDTPDRFLHDVVPAVHCKGAQYSRPLPEETTLTPMGARVELLPMVPDSSTTDVAQCVIDKTFASMPAYVRDIVKTHHDFCAGDAARVYAQATRALLDAVAAGRTVFFCGNGGSAASAQHFSAEFIGRYKTERRALPALALTTDTSVITALGNDYGYDSIFARQLEALAQPGDVLIALSTSGSSANVLRALETAAARKLVTIAFVGAKRGTAATIAAHTIVIPSTNTPIIQEMSDFLLHRICEEVDAQCATP